MYFKATGFVAIPVMIWVFLGPFIVGAVAWGWHAGYRCEVKEASK
jgi:hypothetical protein